MSLANFLDPATLFLSPTTKNPFSVKISFPETLNSKVFSLRLLGFLSFAASAINFICLGVVPQHPPIIFIPELFIKFFNISTVSSGVSLYSPISLGSPAFGYIEIGLFVNFPNLSISGNSSVAPKEQFKPNDKTESLSREVTSDSIVCPDNTLPNLSTVREIIMGKVFPSSEKISSAPTTAAFAFKPSNIVSIRRRSPPPLTIPLICSL